MTNTHGGNLRQLAAIAGCKPEEILDFSANINPLGFPDWVRPLLNSHISSLVHYPDPHYQSLRKKIASHYGVQESEIVLGNGSSEILYALPTALELDKILLPIPSYADYETIAKLHQIPIEYLELQESEGFSLNLLTLEEKLKKNPSSSRLGIFLGNPNNPTGLTISPSGIRELASKYSNCIFVLDEAFLDFTNIIPIQERCDNIVQLHSMTKLLALPGLRIGFALCKEKNAIAIQNRIPAWSVNTLAAEVLERCYDDLDFFQLTKNTVASWRAQLAQELASTGLVQVFPSEANYLFLKVKNPFSASSLTEHLLRHFQIAIRNCKNYPGLNDHYVRVAVRRPEENAKLIQALQKTAGISTKKKSAKHTPALMLQGTGSNVGKSILSTALCRILYQDGLRVAPFKAQNMALNSFVTREGGEIGRAQALQAQACKLLPDTRMNPVLLKPSNESGSQVIVNGKPIAHMDFRDYSRYKNTAFEEVKRAYDSLAAEQDVMVLEGAGSASEVNLKKNDIVNMRMAQHAGARVLLVGNIDHGGIFGAFVGTMETLSEWERDLVAGFIINRFRGIKELLDDGIHYLHAATGKPVLGIVPHLKGLQLPEEDSLEFKSGNMSDTTPLGNRIDIALIDTPRISNFTDLDALRMEEDVRVRHVQKPDELGNPDVLILAGSKSVVADLEYIRESGLADAILKFAHNACGEIVGICGGYQMLGERILDPAQIESTKASSPGLGLLPLETIFAAEKTLTQATALHLGSCLPVQGYEIHHGQTSAFGDVNISIERSDGYVLGHASRDGKIWGSYLHGIFDADEFRLYFLDKIRERKGLAKIGVVRTSYTLEKSMDRLAASVRESLDMKRVYEWLGL